MAWQKKMESQNSWHEQQKHLANDVHVHDNRVNFVCESSFSNVLFSLGTLEWEPQPQQPGLERFAHLTLFTW